MKMKKAIAGLVAGIVAVSAMAMTTVSAKEVTQAAEEITWDLTSGGYKNSYVTELTAKGALMGTSAAGTLVFNFTEAVDSVSLTLVGTKDNAAGTAAVAVTETLSLAATNDNKTYTLTEAVSAGVKDVLVGATYDEINSATLTIKSSTKFDSKADADKDANKKDTIKVTPVFSTGTVSTIAGALGFVTATEKTLTSGDAAKAEVDKDGIEIKVNSADVDPGTYDLNGGLKSGTDLTYAIAKTIGNKKGATLAFNFKATTSSGSSNIPSIGWSSTSATELVDLRVNNAIQAGAKVENNSVVYDWDALVAGTGLNINGVALISTMKLNFKPKAAGLILQSVTIKVPAKTFDDLSAGESSSDSAAEVTTAAPATEATTTAAATNPGTGNAPIALAVIPVAIAAAAIIAKKRG